MPFNVNLFKYELFFKFFPVSKAQQYKLIIHDFMNPKERRYYKDKIQYYVFKATPLESYTNPLMIKGKPLFLHLPQQSFKIAVSEEMYKHTEEFSMLGKTFDVRITFRRINPKVIIIDEFQVTEIKINNNLDSEVTQ